MSESSYFDLVISWGLPIEHLLAAYSTRNHLVLKPQCVFDDENLAPAKDKGISIKKIAVLGTYFENIYFLQEFFPDSEVEVLPHGKRFEELVNRLGDKWTKLFLEGAKGTSPESVHFYRGLLHRNPVDTPLFETLSKYMYLEYDEEKHFVEECRVVGQAISEHQSRSAAINAKYSSIDVNVCGHHGRLLYGAWTEVMPSAMELAKDCDVGILARLNPRTGNTHMTFYTHHSPEHVDMHFVEDEPFNGGGNGNTWGCALPFILPISKSSIGSVPLETYIREVLN